MQKSRVTIKDEMKRSKSTVIVYHGVCLKRYDVELLYGPHWINDQIIAFYFQYLESQKFAHASEKLLFVPPAVAQLIKMSPSEDTQHLLQPLSPGIRRKVILFAVNNNETAQAGGTHWSLLVFSRTEDTFFNFDSLNYQNRGSTLKMVEVLKIGLNCTSAVYYEHDCLQQSNGYDCGIHVLANAENIVEFFLDHRFVQRVPKVDRAAVSNKRREIINLITEMGGNL